MEISRQLGVFVVVASGISLLVRTTGPPQTDVIFPSVTTLLAILLCAFALCFPLQAPDWKPRQSFTGAGFAVAALTLITGSLVFWLLWGRPRTTDELQWIMAPNTAFVLLLVAVAILCLQATRTIVLAQGLAILALTLCLLALMGYIEGAFALASLGTAIPLTVPAAVLVVGISLSVLYARPDMGLMAIVTSQTLAGTVARRLMIPLVLLPVLLNFLFHQVAEVGWYAPGLENGLFTFATMLTIAALVWWQVLTLYGEQSRRQHLEEQAHKAELRYAELVQAVTDYAIYTLDADGRINSWNAGAAQIRGYTDEEILGQPDVVLFPQEAGRAAVPQQMLEKARREGRVVDESWQLRKDGSRFYAHSILTSVNDPQGQLLGFANVTRDITAQKRAEVEQIKLRSLLNTVVDPILVIDQNGIVETFNPAAERVFGYRADEVLQRNVSLLMPSPDRELHDQYLRRFLETRDPHVIGIGREIEARRKDGSIFPAELTVSEMTVDGRCMFTGIVRDISTRKAVEESIKRSEERLSLALEAGHIGVWDLDMASGSIAVTGDLFATLEVPHGSESVFSSWVRLNHLDDQALVQEQFEQVTCGQRNGMEMEHRLPMKNGAWRWLFSCARVSRRDSENRALTMHGVTVDIHERKTTEDALRKSQLDMDLAMKAAAFHIWHFHCREKRLADLDTLVDRLGYAAGPHTHEVSFWETLLHPDDLAHWRGRELLPLPDELGYGGIELRLRARDGNWRWMVIRARMLEVDRQGAPVIVAGTCLDITASKHAAEQLLHAAQHDTLTGLPNRALTFAFGERILEATPRHGGQCAVLFIDLDHFKPINDHYGHAAGDLVLREVAKRLQQCVRSEDVVGRLGGDEFVVILAHVQKVEDITHIAADCLAAVGSPIAYLDLELQVSSSIGISLYPADGPDVGTLVKHADTAMYHAKQQGRNNFQFFTHAMNARAKSLLKPIAAKLRWIECFNTVFRPICPIEWVDEGS